VHNAVRKAHQDVMMFEPIVNQLNFIKSYAAMMDGGELTLSQIDDLLGEVRQYLETCFNHASIIRGLAVKARISDMKPNHQTDWSVQLK
jgi:hypothetical protein